MRRRASSACPSSQARARCRWRTSSAKSASWLLAAWASASHQSAGREMDGLQRQRDRAGVGGRGGGADRILVGDDGGDARVVDQALRLPGVPQAHHQGAAEDARIAMSDGRAGAHPGLLGRESLEGVGEGARRLEDDPLLPEPGEVGGEAASGEALLAADAVRGGEHQLRLVAELTTRVLTTAGTRGELLPKRRGVPKGGARHPTQGEAQRIADGQPQDGTLVAVL